MSEDNNWDCFNIPNIMQEAKARLTQHRRDNPHSVTVKDTMEYWIAWAAHANAVSALAARPDREGRLEAAIVAATNQLDADDPAYRILVDALGSEQKGSQDE